MKVSVNGFEFKHDGSDTESILCELLKFLEIDGVNMTDSDNYEEMSRMRDLMDNWDDFDE